MGREQALETGKRIAEMIRGADGDPNSPCHVKIVRVSNLARAKETADLLASQIPEVERAEPDPLLNEGRCVLPTLCYVVANSIDACWFVVRLLSVQLTTPRVSYGCHSLKQTNCLFMYFQPSTHNPFGWKTESCSYGAHPGGTRTH